MNGQRQFYCLIALLQIVPMAVSLVQPTWAITAAELDTAFLVVAAITFTLFRPLPRTGPRPLAVSRSRPFKRNAKA